MNFLESEHVCLPDHNLAAHRQWTMTLWHASRVGRSITPPIESEAFRYVPRDERDFLDVFFEWYDRNFLSAYPHDKSTLKDQTYLTILAFPSVRDFDQLCTINHGMLLIFYVDDHRRELQLEELLDDTDADRGVQIFTEHIRREVPDSYDHFRELFREFCVASLLQGKVQNSQSLYFRVKAKTMGIVPVHYLLWAVRGLPPEKFGSMEMYNYEHYLELETLMVNDRDSLRKESNAGQWNGIAVYGHDNQSYNTMIDENYSRLITSLGELLAIEDDQICVTAYENFKICADATLYWNESTPRYHSDRTLRSDTPTRRIPMGPRGIGTTSLQVAR
ncbi:hypothetical protein [Nocardia sp. NPDC056100]|uniref:hypothetical protein n=1 Tax=Nocardia sp. NPDC056100 TaxID=3345712 RepID=UPI0035DDE400